MNLTLDGDFNWVKKFGGYRTDRLYTMTTDLNGNIYFGGIFEDSLDIDPGANEEWLVHVGSWGDAFLVKLDSQGNLIWGFSQGGTGVDYVGSLYVDMNNDLYVGGSFDFTVDFDPGPGLNEQTAISTAISVGDGYIQKLDESGQLLWVRTQESTSISSCNSISGDSQGNIYTGITFNDNLNLNSQNGSSAINAVGIIDGFLAGYSTDGNYLGGELLTGTSQTTLGKVIVNEMDEIYLQGGFILDVSYGNNPPSYSGMQSSSAYVLKLGAMAMLEETVASQSFIAYPNPTKGVVHLGLNTKSEVSVYSLQGEHISTQIMDQNAVLNLEDLSEGSYLIRISNDFGSITEKVVKE